MFWIADISIGPPILNHGDIPPNLHFNQPNQYIDFQSHKVQVVTAETHIDHQANIGVSSFGFGGSNAHVIIKGAQASVRKKIRPLEIPFDRGRAAALDLYLRVLQPQIAGSPAQPKQKEAVPAITRERIANLLTELFFELTGIEEIDPQIELTDQGLDSMSATELISQLEASLDIEIGPEILFEHPLRDPFVDEMHARANGDR